MVAQYVKQIVRYKYFYFNIINLRVPTIKVQGFSKFCTPIILLK